MPRKYVRKVASRQYKAYSDETLQKALTEIVEGRLSQTEASKRFKIPVGMLNNNYNGKHHHTVGGQTSLTIAKEKALVDSIKLCGEWGFPLTSMDIRLLTKRYLEPVSKKLCSHSNVRR